MFKFLMLNAILAVSLAYGANNSLKPEDKAALDKAFEQYEDLHEAFYEYEQKEVQKEAEELKGIMEKIQDPELSKLLKFSQKKLEEISGGKDRKENNQNMHLVSMAMIHVMNKYDVDKNYKAFQCPMVKKKWIQNTKEVKEVQNPYAPEMPNCGGLDK